jgi:hypothetical protein
MIPYLLAVVGGYLLGNSKSQSFSDISESEKEKINEEKLKTIYPAKADEAKYQINFRYTDWPHIWIIYTNEIPSGEELVNIMKYKDDESGINGTTFQDFKFASIYEKSNLEDVFYDKLVAKYDKRDGWRISDDFGYYDEKDLSFADGGSISYLGNSVSDYDLEKLHEDGMTIKELKQFFKERFPYSFGFQVHTYKTMEDLRYLKPNQDDPLYGIEDENLRLGFDKFHSMDYRVFQGDENTYFYFLLNGSDNKSYIGEFGFKDRGDVPKEYVTSFTSLLHKLYGFPFKVSHEVY